MNPYYMRDLEQLLSIRYELEHTPLSPRQRQVKETSLEALQIILDMYNQDNR